MDIVYLGLFSKVLNWVLDKIFNPIFKFISNLLSTVFGWIFDKVLGPIISSVLVPIMNWLIETIFELFAEVFYRIYVAILSLVDTMQMAFDVLIGLTPVKDDDSLLDVLIQNDNISTAFWQIAILGLGIAMMLTIFATAKSAFDLDFENKRPVGAVMRAFFKTCVNFLMVPLLCLFMVKLSGVILSGIDTALAQGECTIGNTIFLTSSLDAAKNSKYNTSTASDPTSVGFTDKIRNPYYEGSKSYKEVEIVRGDFVFSKFDYVVGYFMSIFVLIILALCLITFVQRIFEVIVLYLISPLFVSTMPLDDGEHFKKWREMFIAKIFTGFGSAIGMRVYLMLVPVIMGNSIVFYNSALGERMSTEMTYVMKLLFVVGGAFAVWKSSSMLTTLLNFQAGQGEHAAQGLVGGAAAWAGHKAVNGVSSVFSSSGSRSEKEEAKREKKQEADQRFNEISQSAAGSSGIPGVSAKSMNLVKKAEAKDDALRKAAASINANAPNYAKQHGGKIGGLNVESIGESASQRDASGNGAFAGGIGASGAAAGAADTNAAGAAFGTAGTGTSGAAAGAAGTNAAGAASGTENTGAAAGAGTSGAGGTLSNGAAVSSPKLHPKAGRTALSLGSLKFQYNKDGKIRLGWSGKLVRFGQNGDGTSGFRILGMGKTRDASGRTVESKTWFTKKKYDENGNRTSLTVNIPKLAKVKVTPNGRQLKSIPLIGLKTKQQADGKAAVTNLFGMKFAYSVDSQGKRKLEGAKVGSLVFGAPGADTMPESPAQPQAAAPENPAQQQSQTVPENPGQPPQASATPEISEQRSAAPENGTQQQSAAPENGTQQQSAAPENGTQQQSRTASELPPQPEIPQAPEVPSQPEIPAPEASTGSSSESNDA